MINVLNKHLENVLLSDITSNMIKDAHVKLRSGDSPSGRCLSGTYLHDAHKVLRMILANAEEDGMLFENPCDKVPTPKIDTPEKKSLTTEEVLKLDAKLAEVTSHHVAVRLALFCGLRRSEICALRWDDYKNGFLSVSKSCENDGSIKSTKTKAGVREVPLDKSMQDVLDSWHKVQAQQFAKKGIDHEGARIITDEQCTIMTPWNLGRWWNRNREELGAPNVTFHELRHTYLTMLVHSGANLDAARRIAGHSKVDVLIQIYTHRNQDAEREAVDNMMRNLRRKCTN